MSKIVTPEFRGSFVNVIEPRLIPGAAPGTKPKYQMTMALPPDHPFWEEAEAAIEAAAKEKWGKMPPRLKSPIKNGDDTGRPEFEGKLSLQFSGYDQPGIVNQNLNPVVDPNEIYSGAWYRVSTHAFAWDHPTGGKGVSFALDNVMKVKDDEAFSGRTDAASDFGEYASESEDSLLD